MWVQIPAGFARFGAAMRAGGRVALGFSGHKTTDSGSICLQIPGQKRRRFANVGRDLQSKTGTSCRIKGGIPGKKRLNQQKQRLD
jgi:hypothetical protein